MATDKTHKYEACIKWTGNKGEGTNHYQSYGREHTISIADKIEILGSSDPAFMGDPEKHNPEELLVSSLSACHMLWYLHLCAQAGVIVIDYIDRASGLMVETENGSGRFTEVTLSPSVTVTTSEMMDKAMAIHAKANQFCFIANSVNFPVHHKPQILVKEA
jgi:organic hydroperoxide reductase OsmC/OhrA